MAVKVIKAAIFKASMRKVDTGGEPAFELVLDAAQDQPPGNRPPTMKYLLFRSHIDQLVDLLTQARAAAEESPAPNGQAKH